MDTMTVNFSWMGAAALILSIVLAAVLIVLVKKGVISGDTIMATGDLLDTVSIAKGDGFIALLAEYARIAVHAVEQLAKTGVIPNDGETKKVTALQYVEQFAIADDCALSDLEKETAGVLIEAAVAELPRNNK